MLKLASNLTSTLTSFVSLQYLLSQGHEEVVRELLEHNPSLGTLDNGSTPLHAAALSGHPQVRTIS